MADPGSRYRSVSAAGLGTEAVTRTITSTLRAIDHLDVHDLGAGRLSVARTRRPTWAVVACACTFWLGGLGLLFLLVKQTDAGEVSVTDGPRGCVVVLPPVLDAATAQAIEDALRAEGVPDGRATPTPVPDADDDLDGRTVARGGDAAIPASPPTAPPRAVLRVEGAQLTLEPGRPVVLGRDPSPTDGASAWRVPGEATTVSKSHLLVAFDGVQVTVEDLGSTNGSAVVHDGRTRSLVAGDPTPVRDGDRVTLGAVELVVHTDPSPLEVTRWS